LLVDPAVVFVDRFLVRSDKTVLLAKLEVAKNLFATGFTAEQVAQWTELPLADVEKLRNY
jgi:hypothetical protein